MTEVQTQNSIELDDSESKFLCDDDKYRTQTELDSISDKIVKKQDQILELYKKIETLKA